MKTSRGIGLRAWRAIAGMALAVCIAPGCGMKMQVPATTESTQTTNASPATVAEMREITVAAASDLKFAFDDLVAVFQKQHSDIHVKVTYGSSGNFFAQLSQQAPFDLYLSADIDYPRKLIAQELAIRETEFTYAFGHIVVWVPNDSSLKVEERGIETLLDPAVRWIAIANPKHAPYGRAAEAALKSLGVYDPIADRLVLGENVAQTAQFVETGAADIGIIALSLAMSPALRDKGRYWQVPTDAHPPLEQGGVILSWVKDREAADKLREFMISDAGLAVLAKYGFGTSDKRQ
jgi:molybdate transport system substrate-binding protein